MVHWRWQNSCIKKYLWQFFRGEQKILDKSTKVFLSSFVRTSEGRMECLPAWSETQQDLQVWSIQVCNLIFQNRAKCLSSTLYQQNAFAIISLKEQINKNGTAHEEAEYADISLFILAASLTVSAAPFIISPWQSHKRSIMLSTATQTAV